MRRVSSFLLVLTAAAASAQTQQAQPSRLGVDTANFDRTVRAQDDFYRFVNGGWLSRTQIPADRSSYGSFLMLADKSDDAVLAIAHDAANAHAPNGSAQQKIGDFYRAYMDTVWIERAGAAPLKPELDRINAMLLTSQLPAEFARLRRIGVSLPFGTFVNQDQKNATQYALYINQARLGMPDRDYYLRDDQKF